ncbi:MULTISPECIES: hypothetical protein [Microbacterium]|jgi:hypothetical protein|uniref:hypothetical protein n=1 Tax=Microbacterium TaxID=33882 RepID=UPI001D17275F|nr:hypothetical protein [Microbacterium testaceum]MCC4248226.1 hypothetical protein [Microbacterium testaceum]
MARIDLASQFHDVRSRVSTQPTTPPAAGVQDGPKYRRLTRKETLLHADQLVDLAALARFRMKQRRIRTERITENSLVRIAVDLLLDNQDLLDGSTEAELRDSILIGVARLTARSETPTSAEGRGSELPRSDSPEGTASGSSEARSEVKR